MLKIYPFTLQELINVLEGAVLAVELVLANRLPVDGPGDCEFSAWDHCECVIIFLVIEYVLEMDLDSAVSHIVLMLS